ncbi:MAG TPA: gliding motility protein GldC [Ignavibacteriaceae bacterium]|nr:gliding motility protein GldC [Ignavibacteriaceae bacterium]
MQKKSKINFTVELDEKNLPKKIEWDATDSNFEGKKECKAMMLSIWDKEENVTLGIDLWTEKMLVEEMDIFFHQVFKKMSDTYLRSTSNNDVAKFISEFSEKFADKVQLGKKK